MKYSTRRVGNAFLCVLLLFCVLNTACWTAVGFASPAQENSRITQANGYLAEELAKARVPFSMAVFVGPEGELSRQGFGSVPEEDPGDKAFVLGSLSKSFTALAVQQLAEAGKIDLDAPLAEQLPGWAAEHPGAPAITPRALLRHSSGVSTYETTGKLRFAGQQEQFSYANANYELLGQLVEAASGQSFEDYLQTQVLEPLGMKHSGSDLTALRQAGTLTEGHRSWFGGVLPHKTAQAKAGEFIGAASGNLAASAADMALYLQMMLNEGATTDGGQLLSNEGVAALTTGSIDTGNDPAAQGIFADVPGRYGMGWVEKEIDGVRLVYHSGKAAGYNALMALLPEQGVGFVLLCNLGDFLVASPMIEQAGEGALRILLGVEPLAQWEYNHLLQHIVIDLICLIVLLTALMPLFMWGMWKRRLARKPADAPLYIRLVLLHGIYPGLMLGLPVLAGIPPRVLAAFAPDIALTLYLSAGVLLVTGLVKLLRLTLLRRRRPKPAIPAIVKRRR